MFNIGTYLRFGCDFKQIIAKFLHPPVRLMSTVLIFFVNFKIAFVNR